MVTRSTLINKRFGFSTEVISEPIRDCVWILLRVVIIMQFPWSISCCLTLQIWKQYSICGPIWAFLAAVVLKHFWADIPVSLLLFYQQTCSVYATLLETETPRNDKEAVEVIFYRFILILDTGQLVFKVNLVPCVFVALKSNRFLRLHSLILSRSSLMEWIW